MEAWNREMEEAMVKRLQEEEGNSDGKAPRLSGGWGWQTYASFLLVFFIFFWVADLSTDGVVSGSASKPGAFFASKPKGRRSLRGAVGVSLPSNYTAPVHFLNETATVDDFLQRSHGTAAVVPSGDPGAAVGVHGFKPKKGHRLGGAMEADSVSSDATSAHELNQTALDGNFLQRMDKAQTAERPGVVHITFTPGLGGAPDGGGVWQLHYFDKVENVKYTPKWPNPDNPNDPQDNYFELLSFSAIPPFENDPEDRPYTELVADNPKRDTRVRYDILEEEYAWISAGLREFRYAILENACVSFDEGAKIFAGRRTLPRGGKPSTPINWPPNMALKDPHKPESGVRLPNVIRVETIEETPPRQTFGLYRGARGDAMFGPFIPGARLRFWVTGFGWKKERDPCKIALPPAPGGPGGWHEVDGTCENTRIGSKFSIMRCVQKMYGQRRMRPLAKINRKAREPEEGLKFYSPGDAPTFAVKEISVWPPAARGKQQAVFEKSAEAVNDDVVPIRIDDFEVMMQKNADRPT
ncbi:unnamed protein product [Amoebophrya sp. A25]|nr:unnamed protein product [Amoebophrya sp. A25]|eukprot:GSA25T00015068001.1